MGPPTGDEWIALSSEALPVAELVSWATLPSCGGVGLFLGVVRDHSEGREGVTSLTYEAYDPVTTERLRNVADEARRWWPELARIGLLHRVGDVQLSEPSVAVVVSSPHRAEALDAARFCIDALKETVPLWKREHWSGGSDWSPAGERLRALGGRP
jgi:molybdopterin synthase catalytic subunit